MKHFIQFENRTLADHLIERALEYKADPRKHISKGLGKRVGCIFLNPSLRTRASTQIAALNLGMDPIIMNMDKEGWALEMQEGAVMNKTKVEHIKDAAAVLGIYFDILAIRALPTMTNKEEDTKDFVLNQFKKYSGIPIISLESAVRHPLQSLADMITIQENTKIIKRSKVVLTWAPHVRVIPQAVANSFAEWTIGCGHDLTIAHPEGYDLDPQFSQGAVIELDQQKAMENADFVYVKNWSAFDDYGKINSNDPSWMLTESHFKNAPEAKIMHCLPVRRNVEISDEVLDGPRSIVQQQAENRIYAAQAVLSRIIE